MQASEMSFDEELDEVSIQGFSRSKEPQLVTFEAFSWKNVYELKIFFTLTQNKWSQAKH
jgi:hypothetical protein